MQETEVEADEEFEADEETNSRNIAPTKQRGFSGDDHRQPWPPFDNTGRRWRGFSRVKDRPARRKANKRRQRKYMTLARLRGMGRFDPVIAEQKHLRDIAKALEKATGRGEPCVDIPCPPLEDHEIYKKP
jgi:hypothetical protein